MKKCSYLLLALSLGLAQNASAKECDPGDMVNGGAGNLRLWQFDAVAQFDFDEVENGGGVVNGGGDACSMLITAASGHLSQLARKAGSLSHDDIFVIQTPKAATGGSINLRQYEFSSIDSEQDLATTRLVFGLAKGANNIWKVTFTTTGFSNFQMVGEAKHFAVNSKIRVQLNSGSVRVSGVDANTGAPLTVEYLLRTALKLDWVRQGNLGSTMPSGYVVMRNTDY